MAISRGSYWAFQLAVIAWLVTQAFVPVPWQFAWGVALVAECILVSLRLKDAGHRPWLALIWVLLAAGTFAVVVHIDRFARHGPVDNGASLGAAMINFVVILIVSGGFVLWPGLTRTKASRNRNRH